MKFKNYSRIRKFFFENRLNDSISKPKELQKTLKSLGLSSKKSTCETNALKVFKCS